MQVSVETTNGLGRKLTVAVEEERISQEVEKRLKEMTKTVRINGFRKGKVPLTVVRQQYGSQVRGEIMSDVLQNTFYEAVSQEKLRPAGMPQFDASQSQPGKGLEYTATFEVYPDVEVADLSKSKLEKPVCNIADSDIDEVIESIREQNKVWNAVERAAKDGDRLNIDFVGSIDGEKFPGGEGKGMSVELGSGRMIKGFEEGLVGASAGSDVTLNVTFPEEYHAENLAGKPAEFAVHVNSVEESALPEVNAELAEKMGIEGGDLAKMREEVKSNMARELNVRLGTLTKQAVMDLLIEKNSFDIPAALVESESRAVMQQTLQNLSMQGVPAESVNLDPSMFRDQAERRVKLGLIMAEIVDSNGIKVSADKVKEKVEEIAAPYEHPAEVVKWYYADRQRLQEVESLVLEQQVVDWVLEQAKVSEKDESFKDIMNPKPQK